MDGPRVQSSGTLLANGRVFVVGAFDAPCSGKTLASAELFDAHGVPLVVVDLLRDSSASGACPWRPVRAAASINSSDAVSRSGSWSRSGSIWAMAPTCVHK